MQLLVLAAIIGAPVSAFAYCFLKLVAQLQTASSPHPEELGFDTTPTWWPVPWLTLAGLVVARHPPASRRGGHLPAEGFQPPGVTAPIELPASCRRPRHAGLRRSPRPRSAADRDRQRHRRAHRPPARGMPRRWLLGHRRRRQLRRHQHVARLTDPRGVSVHGGRRRRRAHLGVILVAGLLAAGIGRSSSSASTAGPASARSRSRSRTSPTSPGQRVEFLWAIVIGLGAVFLRASSRGRSATRPFVAPRHRPAHGRGSGSHRRARHRLVGPPGAGRGPVLGAGGAPGLLDRPPPLVRRSWWSSSARASPTRLGRACRGGPDLPRMFVGAAAACPLALPGLPMIAGAAMGIGAMTVVMLRLPADLGPARHAVPPGRQPAAHAARDRRGRRGLRDVRAACPGARAGGAGGRADRGVRGRPQRRGGVSR